MSYLAGLSGQCVWYACIGFLAQARGGIWRMFGGHRVNDLVDCSVDCIPILSPRTWWSSISFLVSLYG